MMEFTGRETMVSVRGPLTTTHGIPRVVYRTKANLIVNKLMYRYSYKKWFDLNPAYSMVWYKCKDCDEFMKVYFSGKVHNAYQRLKPGAYKADLWRLCILYQYGGIYVDAAATPHVPFSLMLGGCFNRESEHQFISVLDCATSGNGIHNGFIVATKKHPFLKQGIDDIVYNVENEYYGESELAITGPIALSKSINRVLKRNEELRHNKGWNLYGKLSFYLFSLNWGVYQNIYKRSTVVVSKRYGFLNYLERLLFRTGYKSLWKRRDIFLTQ